MGLLSQLSSLAVGAAAGAAGAFLLAPRLFGDEKDEDTLISCEQWGEHPSTGEQVFLWTLRNEEGFTVKISTLGCTVTSVVVPDVPVPGKKGSFKDRDVILGYDSVQDQVDGKNNFGSIVGRCANRIKDGQFKLQGKQYQLAKNNGNNHLHGGPGGFFSKNFKVVNAVVDSEYISLALGYISPDGEEGYPGSVEITMTYKVPRYDNDLEMHFLAENASQPTVVSLTNHAYWNLLGHDAGSVESHELVLPHCTRYTETRADLTTTGETPLCMGSDYDFFSSGGEFKKLGPEPKFDLNYCIDIEGKLDEQGLRTAARLRASGLEMVLRTNAPGIQLYCGSGINPTSDVWKVKGKGSAQYQKYGAVCLEPQNWPDAINQTFPHTSVLKPKDYYKQMSVYSFRNVEDLYQSIRVQQADVQHALKEY